MSGGVVFTSVGRDEMVKILQARIKYFKLGEGGFVLSGETIEVIEASEPAGKKIYDHVITGGDFDIVGVAQVETGQHTGPDNSADLVDSGAAWTVNEFAGDKVNNLTDGSDGVGVSNTATTVVAVLSGGTDDDWDISDQYQIDINKFTIAGLYASYFPVGARVKVEGSTGNDGLYTVEAVVEAGGDTIIKVEEAIPSAVIDGSLYVNHLPIALGKTTGGTHYPLVVEELTPGLVVVQSISDTTAEGVLAGDGVGTINYKNGSLHIVFNSDVGVGNSVRVRFKYHDARKDASGGSGYTYLESSGSPVAADGERELFTFTKEFGADAETIITFRGVGFGTIRCTLKLQLWEGIDDGRGATYGGVPFYFEGGVFDDNDVLLAYFTFDKERKTGSVIIEHTVDFVI
jgi:hypothetical protein